MPRYKHSATRRRKQRVNKRNLLVVLTAFIALTIVASSLEQCYVEKTPRVKIPSAESLMEVITNPNLPEQSLRYKGMDISFNPNMHIPNWVSWELTGSETTGSEPRHKKFMADPDVSASAEPYDYSYTGYDRGHMAPAGDMKWHKEAMMHTFYMTNICPQVPELNSGAWLKLEEKCRVWARADSAIIIIAGPVLTDTITEYIGDTRVAVPKRFFKVVLAPYANPPRGIGFIMDNGRVEGGMQRASMSIDEVERITGHDFFSSLPDALENFVESQHNFHQWSKIK